MRKNSVGIIGSKSEHEVAAPQLEILKDNEELKKKFDKVVQVVQISFIKRNVNLHEILLSLHFIKSHEEKEMVKNHFRELLQVQSLHVLFFTFSDIWDYIHPGLLEFIVQRFGTTSDRNIVEEYKEDLKEYRRSVKLGDFAKICKKIAYPPLDNKELSVILGEDWRYKTLQDLEDVRIQFADTSICDDSLFRRLPKGLEDDQLQFAHSKVYETPGR